jgi:hypothetical protein
MDISAFVPLQDLGFGRRAAGLAIQCVFRNEEETRSEFLSLIRRGGYDDGIHSWCCRADKTCAGSIAAHPCKKRKNGAPSVGTMQCKDGPPAVKLGPEQRCLIKISAAY